MDNAQPTQPTQHAKFTTELTEANKDRLNHINQLRDEVGLKPLSVSEFVDCLEHVNSFLNPNGEESHPATIHLSR